MFRPRTLSSEWRSFDSIIRGVEPPRSVNSLSENNFCDTLSTSGNSKQVHFVHATTSAGRRNSGFGPPVSESVSCLACRFAFSFVIDLLRLELVSYRIPGPSSPHTPPASGSRRCVAARDAQTHCREDATDAQPVRGEHIARSHVMVRPRRLQISCTAAQLLPGPRLSLAFRAASPGGGTCFQKADKWSITAGSTKLQEHGSLFQAIQIGLRDLHPIRVTRVRCVSDRVVLAPLPEHSGRSVGAAPVAKLLCLCEIANTQIPNWTQGVERLRFHTRDNNICV